MNNDSEQHGGEALQFRLTGVRYPRHALDEDDEALCGTELSDEHRKVIEAYGDDLATVGEFMNDGMPAIQISDLCGNCRRVLLSRYDEPLLQNAWSDREEAINA